MINKISEHVYYVGVQDKDLRKFDVIFDTQYGTTYNAYLVQGSEKTVLIDTVKNQFHEEFLANIEELTPLEKIDFIIINHVEPDHSGSLENLLAKAPQARVICSKVASGFLKEILNKDLDFLTVGTGDSLDLGGLTLKFTNAPFLHWPETMFTYLEEEKVLFPCDFFGSHYGRETVTFSISPEDMENNQKFYFDTIMKPFSKFALEALQKIENLPVEVICPSHGPVLRTDFKEKVATYRRYATPEPTETKILVGYLSCYGYTADLAKEVDRGIRDAGISTELVDLAMLPSEELADKIQKAVGIAIGSATVNRDVIHVFYDIFSKISAYTVRERPAVLFGSYGWSGEALKHMQERLGDLGYTVIGSMRTKLKPDEEALKEAYELGALLAKSFG